VQSIPPLESLPFNIIITLFVCFLFRMLKVTLISSVFLGLICLLQSSDACSSSQGSIESSSNVLASLRKVPLEQTAPENLTFTAGDIISCTLSSVASHIMLASNSTTVIHGMGKHIFLFQFPFIKKYSEVQ